MAKSLVPCGFCYVNWDFGIPELDGVVIDFTIERPLARTPGMYFQLYDAAIGGVGSYHGLQTDVFRPRFGGQGPGLIFSRWKTRDEADARWHSDGWLESSGHEGDFVGIRRPCEWNAGSYQGSLVRVDRDEVGDWFAFSLLDLAKGATVQAGSLRYARGAQDRVSLRNGGGTWIECYSGVRAVEDFPFFHATVTSAVALRDGERHPAIHARSTYAKSPNAAARDISVDAATRHVTIRCGQGVVETNRPGKLF